MWIISIICILVILIIMFIIADRNKDTVEYIRSMRQCYGNLTKEQRYAYYNLLAILAEVCANTSSIRKKQMNHLLKQIAQILRISRKLADMHYQRYGREDLCKQLGSIPRGIRLDLIVHNALCVIEFADGYYEDFKADELAMTLMIKIFEAAGFSEAELKKSAEKREAILAKWPPSLR